VNWRNVLVFRREVAAEFSSEREPVEDSDDAPMAHPVPGPEEVQAPAPISEEVKDPPLTLKPTDLSEKDKEQT
jgi:hypothetical protein